MMFLWAFSKFLLEVHYLGLILPLTFLFQPWLNESHRELATCFVRIGFILVKLTYGKKCWHEGGRCSMNFITESCNFGTSYNRWSFTSTGISSFHDKSIFILFFFLLWCGVSKQIWWEGDAILRFNASYVYHQLRKLMAISDCSGSGIHVHPWWCIKKFQE